jgi:hypothetical protein
MPIVGGTGDAMFGKKKLELEIERARQLAAHTKALAEYEKAKIEREREQEKIRQQKEAEREQRRYDREREALIKKTDEQERNAKEQEESLALFVLDCKAEAIEEDSFRDVRYGRAYARKNLRQVLEIEGPEWKKKYHQLVVNPAIKARLEQEAPEYIDLLEMKLEVIREAERLAVGLSKEEPQ